MGRRHVGLGLGSCLVLRVLAGGVGLRLGLLVVLDVLGPWGTCDLNSLGNSLPLRFIGHRLNALDRPQGSLHGERAIGSLNRNGRAYDLLAPLERWHGGSGLRFGLRNRPLRLSGLQDLLQPHALR